MNKKALIFLPLAMLIPTPSNTIVLQSSILRLLDGVWFALDGDTLYKMSWLIVRLETMLNGKLVNRETKERLGIYKFNNKSYSIKELADLEQKEAKNPQIQKQLQDLLTSIKKEFIEINRGFIKDIQGNKPLIIKIMRESCERRGVPNSFMLRWADTPFGQEDVSFDKNMKSFVELHRFMGELINFMSDIFESCPKGYAQYLEIIKKQRASQGQHKDNGTQRDS